MKPLLFFNLKKIWFDKIESGAKRAEYREIKPFWESRLERFIGVDFEKNPAIVRFRLGYSGRDIDFQIVSVRKTSEKNDLGLDRVYEIKFKDL